MQFKTPTAQTQITDDAQVMICKAGMALSFGDVVKQGTNVDGSPTMVVTQVAADNIGVIGVVSEIGGIASGALGKITIKGPATVNCASQTAWAVNLSINTNGISADGQGNDGTAALGKQVGISMGLEAGTVTQQTVYVNPT
jgi:hypothetical protein